MKKGLWRWLSVVLDVVLVLGALVQIISGQGSFIDYFILFGVLFLDVPAFIVRHYRRGRGKENDVRDGPLG